MLLKDWIPPSNDDLLDPNPPLHTLSQKGKSKATKSVKPHYKLYKKTPKLIKEYLNNDKTIQEKHMQNEI